MAKISAATNVRNLKTLLLMQQFEAREIGARITQARKERGMTQEELAEIASFSKRSLQDYETGVTIPYRHLRELSRLLRKPAEWFLYGSEEEPAGEDAVVREQVARLAARVEENAGLLSELLSIVRGWQEPPGSESRS